MKGFRDKPRDGWMEMRKSEVKKSCVCPDIDNMEGKVKKKREKEGKWKIMVLFRHEYGLNTAELQEQEREFQKRLILLNI